MYTPSGATRQAFVLEEPQEEEDSLSENDSVDAKEVQELVNREREGAKNK